MDNKCINAFKELGYLYYAPIYSDDLNVLNDIEFFNDNERINISRNGAYKEIKEEDEYGSTYSFSPLSYEEMKIVCLFIDKHKFK